MNPIDQSIIENNVLEALENSGRIGKSKVTTITFDGEITGKPFFDWGGGTYIVKISDIAVPIENIKMASVKSVDNNVIGVPKEQMSFIEEVSGLWGIIACGGVLGWICYKAVEYEGDNYEPGVYAIRFPSGAHMLSLVAETIHPIDPKFLPPSRYLLNLSSVTIQQGDSVIHPSIYDFVALAAQNGGSFNTTIPAENCKELVAKATEWAKLSRGEDWNWLTSAPQLVVSDNIGILLMPTAIEHQHSTDPGLLQLFVGGTLRVKNGTTWITTHANCTIFFNEDGSIDMFVTATAA